MVRKFSLLFVIFFMELGVVCVFGQSQEPNADEVLRHYKESLSWLQSVSMKVDDEMQIEPVEVGVGSFHPEAHFIHRRDGSRCEWLGKSLVLDSQGKVLKSSITIKSIFANKQYVDVFGPADGPPFAAYIKRINFEDEQKSLYDDPLLAGPLNGNIYGNNHKNVAELLSDGNDLHLHSSMETLNGISCYVLEATTEHGKVTAWVAPEKGYNALRWVIEKSTRNLFDKTQLSDKWPKIKSWTAMLDSVELQKIDGVFVISGGHFTHTVVNHDGETVVTHDKYKRTEIELNPDF